MKRFSVLIVQTITVLVVLVLPLSVLFYLYTLDVNRAAMQESAVRAQNNLEYVETILSFLNDSANTEMTRVSTSPDYIEGIALITDYNTIATNSDTYYKLKDIVSRLVSVQYSDKRLRNVYLYTLGADYILTSDNGALPVNKFDDWAWLEEYRRVIETQSVARTSFWNMRVIPALDLIKNGAVDGKLPVISYVYGFALSGAKTRSVLVMNYYDSAISKLINLGVENTDGIVMLVNPSGVVLSHPDPSLLGVSLANQPYVAKALADPSAEGGYYLADTGWNPFRPENVGNQMLYAYRRTSLGNWTILNAYSMQSLMKASQSMSAKYIGLMILVLLIGGMLCYQILKRIMRPIKALASRFLEAPDRAGAASRNEFDLITKAMDRMQREENALQALIRQQMDNSKTLYLLSLLRSGKWDVAVPVQWQKSCFCVVVVQIDDAQRLKDNATREQRIYYKMLLIRKGEALADPDTAQCYGLEMDPLTVSFVFNTDLGEDDAAFYLRQLMQNLQDAVAKELPHTISVGIGSLRTSVDHLGVSYQHAKDALRQRLSYGKGCIVNWHPSLAQLSGYTYPLDAETHLNNAILAKNGKIADAVIEKLESNLSSLPADNILQVVNQLISAIVSNLMKNDLPLSLIEGGLQAWYTRANDQETLPELLQVLRAFAQSIMDGLSRNDAEQSPYIARILQYIQDHYRQDICFEDMAAEIGISYSYMRKLVREVTNRSLIDTLHCIRIKHAKQLLADSQLTVKMIAEQVGYNNPQSFERFFRKTEGVSATEYRSKLI